MVKWLGVFCVLFISCNSNIENQIIGEYRVDKFILEDSSQNLKTLKLCFEKNKRFIVQKDSTKIYGDWFAKDYGDFVIIYFENTEGKKDESRFYFPEMEIYFGAPSDLLFPEFKNITFKKL